jgi:formylglycine-generating enzyme required for sulfatase activity
MADTPVTQAQFSAWPESDQEKKFALWKRENNSLNEFQSHVNGFSGNSLPVEKVDWWVANSFCCWLNERFIEQMPSDSFRACLPTEAEWEYACRAGTQTDFYTGDGKVALMAAGWFGEGGINSLKPGQTHPVKLKQPNTWGLFDLHGNVWEFCHDKWDEFAYRTRGDGCPDVGQNVRTRDWSEGLSSIMKIDGLRIVRGASWRDPWDVCRSAWRGRLRTNNRECILGFRVCLAVLH